MFYRRKIILALLKLLGGELEKIRLQKLLFLFTQKQEVKAYDFVPYKFGCYSYSANADLTAMVKRGMLIETETHFVMKVRTNFIKSLLESDQTQLLQTKTQYGELSSNALMKHTYIHYPYWATKSVKAARLLSEVELKRVDSSRPSGNRTILFTIGYEGISLEEYLNRLLRNDVKVLIDVRNNPISMKFGFSKSQLKGYCESLGLQYFHFPEVGIQSSQRQELKNQADYDRLFQRYRRNDLVKTVGTQTVILNLLKKYDRIALTCFEADICQCHRKHLAEAIGKLQGFTNEIVHI